jgi:hypothetical protein
VKQDYQKTYEERNNGRVNIAEIKAQEFYKKKGLYVTRFGFDEKNENIPTNVFKMIPPKIRNMPEYLVIGKKGCWLLEAKGCRDILRVKLEDMIGYEFWNNICRMVIFAYSCQFDCYYIFTYKDLKYLLKNDNSIKKDNYPDNNKEYYAIPVKELTLIGDSNWYEKEKNGNYIRA